MDSICAPRMHLFVKGLCIQYNWICFLIDTIVKTYQATFLFDFSEAADKLHV